MFGIFYEDINYAADGGLYAELVRNRSFEFNSSDNGSFTGMTAWSALNRSGAGTTAAVVNDAGRLNEMNRNYLTLTRRGAGDGIRNAGFNNGFAVAAGKTYDASVWAKSATAQDLTLRVEDTAGTGVLATGTVAVDGTDTWKKYAVELTATGTTDAGRFAVLAGAPSTVALDMVSLMPHDTWVGPVNGRSVLRKDLAEKVAAMNPGVPAVPGWLRHQRRHLQDLRGERLHRPPPDLPVEGDPRPGRGAPRPTRTSGATTSPTASATWSTSSSPRTSAPSRSRSSRSAPTAAAARASPRCTTRR